MRLLVLCWYHNLGKYFHTGYARLFTLLCNSPLTQTMDNIATQSNTRNDTSQNISASGSLRLEDSDMRNTVEVFNLNAVQEGALSSTAAESVDDRSAASGERDNTEDIGSSSPPSLEIPTFQREQSTANTATAPASSTVLSAMNARGLVSGCFSQAKQILRFGFVDNSTGEAILKALKITGAQNAKVSTKLKIIAMKMTQRQFSLQDAMNFLAREEEEENAADVESDPHFLQNLLPSAVEIEKNGSGVEIIGWLRGDVPVFESEEIKVKEPTTPGTANTSSREPDFEASEYYRSLHTLSDARMTSVGSQLMEPQTRDELDRECIDPWTDEIVPLFNDDLFKPHAISSLAGDVTRDDIASIDPSNRIHERPAGVLKRNFGDFKSIYGTSPAKYESSGQGDPDSFVHFANAKSYIM